MINKFFEDSRIERLTRCCILFSFCITLTGIIFIVVLNSEQGNQMISCKTDTCKQISHELFRHLDKKNSPCTDFPQYVCGKKQSMFNVNEENYYTNTMKFVLDFYKKNYNVAEVPLLVDAIEFYHMCSNQEQRNSARFKELFDIYQEIGGWSLVEKKNWTSSGFRYERPLINLYRKLKKNFFFDVEITTDLLGIKIINIKKFQRTFKNDEQWIYKYKEYIKEVVHLIHPNSDDIVDSELEKSIQDIVEFEKELNNVSFDYSLRSTLNMFNLTNYQPNMDWALVISSMIETYQTFLSDQIKILSVGRDTIRHMNKLLRKERVFSNYLGWKITEYYSSYSTISLMKLKKKFLNQIEDGNTNKVNTESFLIKKNLKNQTSSKKFDEDIERVSSDLKEICSKQTITVFQTSIDYLLKTNFLTKGYKKFNELLKGIINSIERKLENSIWSNEKLTKKIINKMNKINLDEIMQISPESRFCYDNFAVSDSSSFINSLIKIESFNHLNEICIQAYKKENPKKAYINKNFEIETRSYLPLISLLNTPNFWLYSRFGIDISKYLLNKIILSDETQLLMTNESKNLFNAKWNCYKDLVFGKIYENSLIDSDELTKKFVLQSESVNLAQELLVKEIIYNGYDQIVESEFDSKQLFFISYLNGYCYYFDSKTQHNQLSKNLINFSIKNSKSFYDVFDCKQDSHAMRLISQQTMDKCILF